MSPDSVNAEVLSFGNRVRVIRKGKKISMEQLAHIAEIELSQIYRIETGKINPKLTTILKIAKALEVEVSDLFPPVSDNP